MSKSAIVLDFHHVCSEVVARAPDTGNGPYAKAYAKAGLACFSADAIHSQALYIRTNLSHWRGDQAKYVKTWLDSIIKTTEMER